MVEDEFSLYYLFIIIIDIAFTAAATGPSYYTKYAKMPR